MTPPRRRRRGGTGDGPRPLDQSLDDVVRGLSAPPGGARRTTAAGAAPAGPSGGRPTSAAAFGAVFSRWEELVGPAVARHAKPLRLDGGTLVVAVDQPAWATQVRVLAPGILARLTEQTGERLERLDVVVRPAR
ncbi:MAG TPA: DUF721 domain-containing protein [Acidimicrobiales bacterium]|nr:DUF721 domain-containing protein [Acidimicrobiales bacterium]